MRKLTGITVIIVLSFAMFNCSNVTDPSERIIYPLKVGNSWEYTRSFTIFNFQPDTFVVSPLEFYSNNYVEITEKDTLLIVRETSVDTVEAYCLYERMVEEDSTIIEDEAYYNNTEDGLYCYLFIGYPRTTPKPSNTGRFYFKGMYFNNIHEISMFLMQELFETPIAADTIFTDETPRKNLHYPIEAGVQWNHAEQGNNSGWRIDKKYIGWEFVSVPAGNFNCMKVRYLYDMDNDDEWDSDIIFFDYIQANGLIKRSLLLTDLLMLSEIGEPLGYVDFLEETVLTGYHLE